MLVKEEVRSYMMNSDDIPVSIGLINLVVRLKLEDK